MPNIQTALVIISALLNFKEIKQAGALIPVVEKEKISLLVEI